MTGSRRRDLAAILFLVLLITSSFADVLFGDQRFFVRDLTRFYFPTKAVIRSVILSGEFPYWNPYYAAGQPMAANPEYEVFYPLQLLILLPDFDLGFRLHIIVHFYIAAIGMYFLLRSLRLRISSCLFGSISVALGGLFLSYGNLLPYLFAGSWIPWSLLFVRRLLIRPNLRDFSLGALFLGLQNLVGEPTTMVQSWSLIAIYAIYRGLRHHRRRLLRDLSLVGIVIAAGLLVGAVQFFPALDHVGDSVRSRPFPLEVITAWSMPFARPLELLDPNLFGHLHLPYPAYWGSGLYGAQGTPFLFSIYLGFLPAALLVCALFVRQRGACLALTITLVSFVLAWGRHTPLYRWLYEAGVAMPFRYPEKFILMAFLAWGILAAILFDRLIRGDRRVLAVLFTFVLLALVITLNLVVVSRGQQYGEVFVQFWGLRGTPLGPVMLAMHRADLLVALGRIAVVSILAALAWVRMQRGRTPGRVWAALTVAFLVADVSSLNRRVMPRISRELFTPPPVVASLKPQLEGFRLFHEADWFRRTATGQQYLASGKWVLRNGLFPHLPGAWGIATSIDQDIDQTHLLPTLDFVQAVWRLHEAGKEDWRAVVMAMSNASFFTVYRDFEREAARVRGRLEELRPVVFIAGERNPRFYFASEIVTVAGADDFLKKLMEGSFSRRVAFVHFPAFKPAVGRVLSVRENSNSAWMEVEVSGPSLLVASITPHKYWRARLDGKPVDLQRVNLGFQGVILPAGKHTLEMRYRNKIVLISLAVTTLATIVLIAAAIRPRRKSA